MKEFNSTEPFSIRSPRKSKRVKLPRKKKKRFKKMLNEAGFYHIVINYDGSGNMGCYVNSKKI